MGLGKVEVLYATNYYLVHVHYPKKTANIYIYDVREGELIINQDREGELIINQERERIPLIVCNKEGKAKEKDYCVQWMSWN